MRQLEPSLEDSIFPILAKLIGGKAARQGTVVMKLSG
jgi:hypothetical protein